MAFRRAGVLVTKRRVGVDDPLRSRMTDGGPDDCWLWLGTRTANGYPYMRIAGERVRVHRLVCERAHGPPPAGAHALHSCDVPLCCNPRHLSWGSRSENQRQSVERGRHVFVSGRHPRAVLSVSEVQAILVAGGSAAALARRFGVSVRTVSAIRKRERWAWVEPAVSCEPVQLELFD